MKQVRSPFQSFIALISYPAAAPTVVIILFIMVGGMIISLSALGSVVKGYP